MAGAFVPDDVSVIGVKTPLGDSGFFWSGDQIVITGVGVGNTRPTVGVLTSASFEFTHLIHFR